MLYELVATIAAGFLGAGVALIARRMVRSLPRWLVPIGAGSAMLIVAIALEYSWFDRTRAGLPDGVEVAMTRDNRAFWRPWTYLYAFVDGFIAVDKGSTRNHANVPQNRMVDIIVFARWQPPTRVRAVFDCDAGRRADIVEGVTLADDGAINGARWVDTGLDHPVTRMACAATS
ncbi:MAG: hypothetical protein AAGD34_00760 [Pseudomonadota bacterium]